MVGYNAKNKDIIELVFLCRICSFILREPVQLVCGHRRCKLCIESTDGESITCSECGEVSQKRDVLPDRGFKREMQMLDIQCILCDWEGKLKDYEVHLNHIHPHPTCQYCRKTFESAFSFDAHQARECDQIIVTCALKNYGCSSTFVRSQMQEHYLTEQHQMSIANFIRRDIMKFINDQHGRVSTMDVDTLTNAATSSVESSNSHLAEMSEMIDALSDGVQTLAEDVVRVNNELALLKNSTSLSSQEIANVRISVEEQNTYLDGLKPSADILQQEVLSMKQRVEDMKQVSYNGVLLWKIGNVSSKIADAKEERQTSVYSPPFYSSPTGYKMRVRIYFQGDGNARRTHMSVFFVLMRGEYDAILRFPFNYKVTFCLFDQTTAKQHIIDSFRPDTTSTSFQRPRSDMNIASGIPKFCPLSEIEKENSSYIRDDTMFIKVMVDFGDTPKLLLPFILGLNPALPISAQQILIKQEMDRRNQQTTTSSSSST